MDVLVDIRLAGHVRRRIARKIGFNALWTKVASGDASVRSPDLDMTGRGIPLPQWTGDTVRACQELGLRWHQRCDRCRSIDSYRQNESDDQRHHGLWPSHGLSKGEIL